MPKIAELLCDCFMSSRSIVSVIAAAAAAAAAAAGDSEVLDNHKHYFARCC